MKNLASFSLFSSILAGAFTRKHSLKEVNRYLCYLMLKARVERTISIDTSLILFLGYDTTLIGTCATSQIEQIDILKIGSPH